MAKVVVLERGGTGLGGSGLKFLGLDPGETLRIKEGSEEVGDAGANTEDRVGDRSAEVDDSIDKAYYLTDTRVVALRRVSSARECPAPSTWSRGEDEGVVIT